jgi:hypothetical protein
MRQQTVSPITESDEAILLALARYHYLTAAQLSRLLYPKLNDRNRYAQRRFKKLETAGYVLRLRALPTPQYGQASHVMTLSQRGRQFVQDLGVSVDIYFRPSEETKAANNSPFMTHRLATIDVMIAVDSLCRDYEQVYCLRLMSERELKRGAVRVDVKPHVGRNDGTRRTAVIPDAWFQLVVNGETNSIAVELDRGTEDQRAWRQKVAAYLAWVDLDTRLYQTAFEAEDLTVAVVCPDETRRNVLIEWTRREVQARNAKDLGDIFAFTASSPVTTPAFEFFFGKLWSQLDGKRGPLMQRPLMNRTEESGVVFQTV